MIRAAGFLMIIIRCHGMQRTIAIIRTVQYMGFIKTFTLSLPSLDGKKENMVLTKCRPSLKLSIRKNTQEVIITGMAYRCERILERSRYFDKNSLSIIMKKP